MSLFPLDTYETDDEYDEVYDEEVTLEDQYEENRYTRRLSVADLLGFLEQTTIDNSFDNPISVDFDKEVLPPLPPLPSPPRNNNVGFAPQAWSVHNIPPIPIDEIRQNDDSNSSEYNPNENQEVQQTHNEDNANWRQSHCAICYNDMNEPCILECGHFFCLPCLEQFLRVAMNSGSMNLLVCPDLACGRLLSEFDIRCILPSHEYKRFLNISSNSNYVKRKQDETWCPRLDCSGCAQVIEGKWLECKDCKFEFCKKCRNASHKGISCSTAKRRAKSRGESVYKSERSTKKWASKNTKQCPRCSEVIQKNGGCHHVVCTMCGLQFCWKCKSPADGPFHCKGKKVAVIVGSVLLSPALIIGGVVAGGAYLVESRVIRRNTERRNCVTYRPVKSLAEKISLEIYWILD